MMRFNVLIILEEEGKMKSKKEDKKKKEKEKGLIRPCTSTFASVCWGCG